VSEGSDAAGLRGGYGDIWELRPYALAGSPLGGLGARARLQAIGGDFMAQIGGNFAQFGDENENDLSEAFLLYRSPHWGDFKIGRQHFFNGPAQNNRLGTLLGFNTADATIWRSPARYAVRLQGGYLSNTAPLGGDGFSGWYGRVDGLLGGGIWGLTFLQANGAGGDLGFSVDTALPLVPYVLEGYMEVGHSPYRQQIATGGLYFPGLFRRTGVKAYLEYQSREGFSDEISLRLRYLIGGRWLVMGYLAQELDDGQTIGGASLGYQWKW
jgi:hypothetical protein